MSFRVATDSGCDLSLDFCKERDIKTIHLKYTIDNEFFTDTMIPKDAHIFYEKMRNGALPHTGALNPSEFCEFWEKLFEESDDPILHICMGSGISSTVQNIMIAQEMFKNDHPNKKVYVIDSKACSGMYGMMAVIASDMRDNGKTIEETIEYIEENKNKINAFYTTNELKWFYLGGRINKLAFTFAKAMNIWPIMTVDENGKLLGLEKIRGKQADYDRLVAITKERVINPEKQTLYFCHSDIPEEADEMAKRLVKECNFKDYKLFYVGPTIGTHTGPGLITFFFIGQERNF